MNIKTPLAILAAASAFFITAWLAYSNSFDGAFHFADVTSITDNPAIRTPFDIQAIWRFWPCRFLTDLSFSWNYRVGKLGVAGYHRVNFIIHVLCGGLAVWLSWRIFRLWFRDKSLPKGAEFLAPFFTGVIFLLHPIQTQAVTYIVQRATLLAALFYFLSIGCYWRYRRLSEETPSRLSRGRLFYILALVFGLCAVFSKESAVSLPLNLIMIDLFFFDRSFRLKRLWPFFLLVLAVPAVMVGTGSFDLARMARPAEDSSPIGPYQYFFTQLRVTMTYLRLLVLPFGQNLDYDYPVSWKLFELPSAVGLFFWALLAYGATKTRKTYPAVAFSLLWFWICLAPESSFFVIKDVLVEHRLYLALFGWAVLIVYVVFEKLGRRRFGWAVGLLAAYVLFLAMMTYQRNFVWADEISLWSDVVKKSPQKARGYLNLGIAYEHTNRSGDAMQNYCLAIMADPTFFEAFNNRGNIYQTMGDIKRAIKDYDEAIRLSPSYAEAYNNRAIARARTNKLDLAIEDFTKAIRLKPDYTQAYKNRSIALAQKAKANR